MERKKNLKKIAAIIIILVFHVVGFAGFYFAPSRALFMQLVPYHLLLMMIIVIITHRNTSTNLVVFIGLLVVGGYLIEWIGVNTHLLFGNYIYGTTLGPKLNGVPLIIGINWFLLVYSAGVFAHRSRLKTWWARVIAGALVLTFLDVLIEPSAIRFNYWHWVDTTVPFKNYVCWFILSAMMLFIFEQMRFKRQSIAAEVLLMIQFLFFAGLLI